MCKPFFSPELHGINKDLKVIRLMYFMKGMSYLDMLRYWSFQVQKESDRWGGTGKKTDFSHMNRIF